MSKTIAITNGKIVNQGRVFSGTILIEDDRIKEISENGNNLGKIDQVFDAKDCEIFPGFIDTHVHFREPGLTHKADIYSESRAAAFSGVTTCFEMPNTNPQTTTKALLEEKQAIAKQNSIVNMNFFVGATNDNFDELRKIDFSQYAGIKVFMGSSTGNMLVDNDEILEKIFREFDVNIAVHAEDESIIKANTTMFKELYGEDAPFEIHSKLRSNLACYNSTKKAIEIAKKYNAKLHVTHLSTKEEIELFRDLPENITAEVTPSHLYFTEDDYQTYGSKIKCNPSIKSFSDQQCLRIALKENIIDTIATDSAPHTWEEKQNPYFKCPSGMPSIQFSSAIIRQLVEEDVISLEQMAEKMAHNPAKIFSIKDRGFIKQGYFADLAIMKKSPFRVEKNIIISKCGWSPFEGINFNYQNIATFCGGKRIF